MTPEQRFDRLERIVRLMVKAGLRSRRHERDQDDKINKIIDLQMKNEERFGKNEERFARLAEAQAHTDRRLDALIDIVRNDRNGRSFGKQ
jgi:coenzyme F420-reducing hydrogenase beta subunit